MNAQRIYKEARPLFWPWCAVVLVVATPLVLRLHSAVAISRAGFLLGIPLLATLSFGIEFQHRTLPLLLSQPAGRMKIWGEKMGVTLVAILLAALIFSLAQWTASFPPGPHGVAFAAAWIVATTAAATFWTLVARSMIGGIVLNVAFAFFIAAAPALIYLLFGKGDFPAPIISAVLYVLLGYTGVMLWLGVRMLVRFQAKGGMAGDDLLTAGPNVLPGAWVRWLRCRPTGAVLNLIRKEFRLLRPVWLISLLAAVGWTCLALLGLLHPQGLTRNFETAVVSAGVITTLIIAILAGSLPLGEERTSGTHSWQLTLPVSARRQWFIKLCMALVAGFVGAGLVPLLIAHRLLGSFADVHAGRDLLVGAVLLTFTAFWCACALKGTVPAVLWALPVMIAIYLAVELGKWAGPALTHLFFSRFDPYANMKFAHAVSRFSSTAFFKLIDTATGNMTDSPQAEFALTTLVLVPTLLYALFQSYRLFRAQVQDRVLSVVRSLLPLATLAFLCSFSSMAFYTSVDHAAYAALDPRWVALTETTEALWNIQSGGAKPAAAHPLELTVEDLAKHSLIFSKSTRRLLGNSHITLSLDAPPHHAGLGCADYRKNPQPEGISDLGYSWYSAMISFTDGSRFFVAFDPLTHYVISVRICAGQPPRFPIGLVRLPR
jgi:hypothetical protein